MTNLAEALLRADKPSAELNLRLWLAIHDEQFLVTERPQRRISAREFFKDWPHWDNPIQVDDVAQAVGARDYTASIDAALSLFPKGWLLISLSEIAADGLSFAKFATTTPPIKEAIGIGGRTLAITICLARLDLLSKEGA